MAGVRIGVSYSAVSADLAGEADALMNIEAEHAAGRCDNFPAGFSASESNLRAGCSLSAE